VSDSLVDGLIAVETKPRKVDYDNRSSSTGQRCIYSDT
jgi:hypothetical protein